MNKYHKIYGPYKRDDRTHKVIRGVWTRSVFGCLAGAEWQWTEKVDGTNVRVVWDGGLTHFKGRSDAAQLPVSLLYRLHELFSGDALGSKFYEPACLYGEGYGPKIQAGGGNYREDQDFVLFDVKVGGKWLDRAVVEGIGKSMGLDVVPIVGTGTLYEAIDFVAAGQQSTWGDFRAEGVMCRPSVELRTSRGNRVICKVKARDYYND